MIIPLILTCTLNACLISSVLELCKDKGFLYRSGMIQSDLKGTCQTNSRLTLPMDRNLSLCAESTSTYQKRESTKITSLERFVNLSIKIFIIINSAVSFMT